MKFSATFLLGVAQILAWGGSFFLLAVLADPIIADTGWSRQVVLAALSLGVLIAGLASPFAMSRLQKWGEQRVLVLATGLIAAGLLLMAASTSVPVYLLAWALIGLGMAGGLYDALFAALGNLTPTDARYAIGQITLVSGFCTTITFPLLALLLSRLGWRGTCVAYAAILLLAVPLMYRHAFAGAPSLRTGGRAADAPCRVAANPIDATSYVLVSLIFVLASVTMTLMSIHLIPILQGIGYPMAGAVALCSMLGPAQVSARVAEVYARKIHPAWTTFASCLLVALGVAVLWIVPAAGVAAILIFGAGNGLRAVVRGTLPLSVFPADQYATVIGRLARPVLIGQAATPLLGSYSLEHFGARGTLLATLALAMLSLILVAVLLAHLNKGH